MSASFAASRHTLPCEVRDLKYIPKATFLIKLWLQKFRWVIEDLNPRTSDLETNTLPPPPPGSQPSFMS